MKNLQVYFVLLLFISVLVRPPVSEDTYFHGGSVSGAVTVLAEASVNEKSTLHSRAINEDYTHWSETKLSDKNLKVTAASSVAGVTTVNEDSPIIAGVVGLAAITGLRELASIFLYLLSDYGEANEDYDLVDICLRAIPFVDPHFVDAYIIRAYFFARTDPVKAEEILLRGLRWNPQDWELYNDLAWLHLRNTTVRKPQPETALRYLKAAVMVKHPYSIERLYGHLLAYLGQKDKAIEVFMNMIDDENISDVDLKLAGKGLEAVQSGENHMSRIFDKLLVVKKQTGTVPVCTSCGHNHHPGEHHQEQEQKTTLDLFHVHGPDCNHEVKKPVHVHGPDCDHEVKKPVHGPDCNH